MKSAVLAIRIIGDATSAVAAMDKAKAASMTFKEGLNKASVAAGASLAAIGAGERVLDEAYLRDGQEVANRTKAKVYDGLYALDTLREIWDDIRTGKPPCGVEKVLCRLKKHISKPASLTLVTPRRPLAFAWSYAQRPPMEWM